ncbi:MAG: HAMP domain-containing protein [Sphingomonadaceae bacterium]|nr:HAMP domain-containing protein [Sphingomonadaceae bacterium]
MTAAAPSQPKQMPRWWRRFILASRRANVFLVLEIVAAIAFLAMIATTWLAFTSAPPNGQLLPSSQVALLLLGTLIPAMALLVLFGRRLAIRRAAGSTARLHVRLVFFFSLVAAIPTLLVAAFAGILFQAGVDFWFSGSSRSLMDNANELARGYYEQNQLQVANETIAMASDMRFSLNRVALTDAEFPDVYQYQLQARELNESAILQQLPDGELRTAAFVDLREGNEPAKFAETALPKLADGEAVVVQGDATRIEAMAPIDRSSGIYLYNARNSDALPFNQWERARSVVEGYNVLTGRARALQLRFNLALFVVSLGLVGLAVWFALRFADRQVEPLTDLVAAARKVGAGNFSLRVEGRTGADEIGMLNRAFNRMTAQLEKQTDALVGANQELEERRTFIEAVLESITAGIISLDHEGRVLLMNSRAHELLLSGDEKSPVGKDIQDFAPQIGVLVEAGLQSGVVSANKGGELLTLAVQVAQASEGSVITFEDITRQLLDQRQAAWSDVARRIAHEIKNPLTPIQLATERLKRRYRTQIEKDGELFDELTSTIVRQVGDLRKMVDEFSSFARLPKPTFRQEDALDIVRQAMFLQEVAHSEVNYRFDNQAGEEVRIACDRHQLGQAMTNILKNAFEAVEAKAKNAEPDYRGSISVELSRDGEMISIAVEDNGIGLPQDRDNIIEPYVTTREKGTGLGLAIVNKIVEEHGGDMTFSTGSNGGSRVTMRFARDARISPEQGHA